VLAHDTCNRDKADRLAAVEHLAHWYERNETHGAVLDDAFAKASAVIADLVTSTRVTRWAYEQVEANSGFVWLKGAQMVPLDATWRRLARAASPAPTS
jgi:hypothetical protein